MRKSTEPRCYRRQKTAFITAVGRLLKVRDMLKDNYFINNWFHTDPETSRKDSRDVEGQSAVVSSFPTQHPSQQSAPSQAPCTLPLSAHVAILSDCKMAACCLKPAPTFRPAFWLQFLQRNCFLHPTRTGYGSAPPHFS